MIYRYHAILGGLALLILGFGACSGNHPPIEGKMQTDSSLLYESGAAARSEIRLPDGTGIVAHGATVVRLSKTFNQASRELWIEGDAMFNVIADAGKPFIVHTAHLEIVVLGTMFRVDAKARAAGEEVDLLSGKLKVKKSYQSDSDNEPEIILTGEMLMINRDIDLMEKEKMDGSELKDWNAGH